MTGIVITSDNVDDEEQLTTIINTLLESAKSSIKHPHDTENECETTPDNDLSPFHNLKENEDIDSNEIVQTLSSTEVVEAWQHDDWEPNEPCPECGSENITVIVPREYNTETFKGELMHTAPAEVIGPDMNHYCKNCDTHLSNHPASELFSVC